MVIRTQEVIGMTLGKRFDFEDEYITLDGGVFATARDRQDAELISKTLNQLYDENEELKQSIDNMGGRLQGLWANYYENRYGIWSEAVEDISKELGFKIYTIYDVPISNSNAKKERINGVKKVNEVMGENEQLKFDKQQLHRAMSREEVRHKQFRDKVFDLIDKKIEEADIRECDCCRNCVADQLLTELKKELVE